MTTAVARNPGTGHAIAGAILGGAMASLSLGLIAEGVIRAAAGPEERGIGSDLHWRIVHIVAGAGAILGAAGGASLGAAPHQRTRAVTGAMLGASAVVLPTMAINPQGRGSTMWDWIGGAAGAAVGAGVGAAGARR